MSKSEETKAVATTSHAALPAHMQQHLDSLAGLGNSRDAADNTLPFLGILQKGSPQVNKQDPEYVKGTEAGVLFNTATKQFWPGEEGVLFVPCGIVKNWVRWIPRTAGGGYVDTYPFDPKLPGRMDAKLVNGVNILPDGNELRETLYTFGLLPGLQQAVIGASSTQLKAMRDWMAMRNAKISGGKILPSFACQYRISTAYQKNEKGDWYTYRISDEGYVDEETWNFAVEFAQMIQDGAVRVGRPDQTTETGDSYGNATPEAGSRGTKDDGIPI